MDKSLRPALVLFAVLTLLCGAVYPLLVTGLAQAAFPGSANGSLLEKDGRLLGSALVGQPFHAPRYFWGRPSGAVADPAAPALLQRVGADVARLREAHGPRTGLIPGDLVAASESGVDPHISPAAAFLQVDRVAAARGLSPALVRRLVAERIEGRTFGVLGEPRVNVLRLNLALEDLQD
jgi:K+-transporting ATPase ATPase C chain